MSSISSAASAASRSGLANDDSVTREAK